MTHKILAVDDHPHTLDIVVMTLRQYGYDVVSSLSPVEGLQLAQEEQPDLILLDVNMPDMDGLEVCRRLRANPKLAAVPIIMFTAEDESYQKLAGFDAGADDYLTKPTDPDEMIARIEGILGKMEESVAAPEPSAPFAERTMFIPSPPARPEMPSPGVGGLTAVLGARGGAGATLIAINLAASIARIGQSTTLVDLDMVQGHIALYFNQRISGSVNVLADLPSEDIQQWLPQQTIKLSRHLELLLAHPNQDGRHPILTAAQVSALLDVLLVSDQHVVADLGRHLSEARHSLLTRADQVIVCLPPERIALSSAKQLLNHLQKSLSPFTTLHTVIFDVGDQMSLPRKAVETYLEHPVQELISISPVELTQSVNKGSILVSAFAQGKTAKQFYRLAQQCVKT
ncbi:MAG: response regulator [Chloroflexi bacterium]|nr:response regulator [Chloroflexota bacterium]